MRVARSLLLVCLLVGLAAIYVAASGHLRELERSFLEGEERAVRAELKQQAREAAGRLRERMQRGPVAATYSADGRLLRPAPPAVARQWQPPALTHAAVLMAGGAYQRALEVAKTSADRAAVYLARGQQTGDVEFLRKALAEEEFAGTDLYFMTALEVFRLQGKQPDFEWRDKLSALLGGPSERLARTLFGQAGCKPVGDRAARHRFAQLRVRLGYFTVGETLYFGARNGDRIELRALSLESLHAGSGPLAERLAEPFDAVVVRGRLDRAGVEASLRPGRMRLVAYYGVAALILCAGTVYAYIAIGRASRLARAKSEFVANVTHELKTPLANIRLFTESLAAGRVKPADEPEFLQTILDESGRLEVLVDGLLHAARGARLERRSVDVRGLLREAEERWRPRLEGEGFSFEVSAPALPPVRGDRESLLRALGNLLDNARKYSAKDRRIELSGEARNGVVRLTVRDHGPGIPVRARSRVLSPFARVESADRKETAGTGLGLSLVVACMEAHGGNISIDDAPGSGAAVSLILPAEES